MTEKESFIDTLKRSYHENPLQFMAGVGMVATGAAKLINALSGVKSRRAYAKQIDRRHRYR